MKVLDENGLRTLWGRVTAAIESLSDILVAAINGKADAGNTVTTDTAQTVSGEKTFSSTYTKFGGSLLMDNAKIYGRHDGNNVLIFEHNTNGQIWIGYGIRNDYPMTLCGKYFNINCGDTNALSVQQTRVVVSAVNGLKLGNCFIRWDAVNSRLTLDNGSGGSVPVYIPGDTHTHTMASITDLAAALPTGVVASVSGNTLTVQLHNAAGAAVGEAASVELPTGSGGGTQATAPVSASLDSDLSYVVPGTETGTVAITAIFNVTNTSGAALTQAQAHSFSAMLLPDTSNVWTGATQDLPEALTGLAAGASTTVTYKLTTAGTSTDIGFGYRLLYHADNGASVTVCQGTWPDVAPA